jgi:N-acetylglucosamine malate deacetylase 1
MNIDKILVLSPHTDDAELGAGGTISRLIDEGKEVHYIAFSGCESSVPNGLPKDILRKECMNSIQIMGILPERANILNYQVRTFPEHRQEILEDMIKFKNFINPDLVLTPSSHDTHQDHSTIYWEALRAFKKVSTIWGYEHPWNNLTFNTDIFFRIFPEHLERKIRALKEYRSQEDRPYMEGENIRALARTRGAQIDVPYAEIFELVRLIY